MNLGMVLFGTDKTILLVRIVLEHKEPKWVHVNKWVNETIKPLTKNNRSGQGGVWQNCLEFSDRLLKSVAYV